MRRVQCGWLFGGLLCGLVLLAGCSPYFPSPPADVGPSPKPVVGTLRVIGPHVRLNGIPAHDGATVYNGDRVSTGENSSAYVYFTVGGFIHLDENTDPSLELIWEQAKCIIRVIGQLIGQSYVDTGEQCIKEIKSPHGSWTSETTAFNLQVTPQRSILTILEGRMALVQPRYEMIGAGQQISVSRAGVEQVRRLSPRELRSVVRWREEFPPPEPLAPYTPPVPPAWCCANGEVFEAPREECLESGGRAYGSFEEARHYCRRLPEPEPGPPAWCCVDGEVFEAPREECLERGGRAYGSAEEARSRCHEMMTPPSEIPQRPQINQGPLRPVEPDRPVIQ